MARKFLSGKPTVDTTPVVTEARQVATSGAITGGGDLSADRTITARAASTSQTGVVQLTDSTSTTDSTVAATATAVKSAKDTADAAVPKSTVTTAGDLIVATGNAAVTRLAAGTSGAALVSTGTSSAPAYSTSINGTAIPSSATLVTTTRTISTTAPLTGGGDLSTDRTLAVSTFTGDSGSGGARGVVPAPAAGDAAAGKYLKADGTWATVSGSGGAPTSASYVVLGADATLSAERTLTGSTSVTVTDNGANGTVVLSVPSGGITTTEIADATIVNADISATAGIVDTKLATISTAGKVSNSATTATASNGASTIVLRDASQNFSTAGTITAGGFSGPLTGNASTATTLQTSRNINGIAFNGSADITVTAAAGTLTGTSLNSTVTSATGLVTIGTSPTITTPALTLSTTTDNAEGRIAWDATNDYIKVGTSAAQATFVPASLPTIVATFSKSGTLATGTGTFRWYNDSGKTLTIGTVRASVGTAPTGASLIVDVNVSASGAAPATIYSTQGNRPTIAASAFTATGSTKSTTTIANTDYLTVDIDQVGSTVAGSDLTVLIWLSYV